MKKGFLFVKFIKFQDKTIEIRYEKVIKKLPLGRNSVTKDSEEDLVSKAVPLIVPRS